VHASRRLLLAIAGATLALPATALEWVSQNFAGTVAPLQTTLDVAFAFKNTSDRPVTIRAVQTNCDCLSAGANKETFAPGEAGVITARFTVGDRIGTYERSIAVVTDDADRPQQLRVRIEVPDPATVEPTLLVWAVGAAADEKTVEIRPAPGVRIDFTETFASNADFRVRLETVKAGEHYRAHVAPVSTANAANAAVRFKGAAANGQVVIVSAYANVR
jgi:hypothetical protein